VAYAPLGRGFLSGRIRRFEDLPEGDFRLSVPRCQGKNFQPNVAVLEQIEEMAAGRQVSPAQLALAWVLAQGVVAIPGTERREFLEQNIAATEIELTEEELASIDTIAPREAIAGDCAGVGFPARSRHPSVCSRPTAAEEFRDGAQ
jgi:aryl-alcohol dehydrogenase-like predicted oxidoreductase